MPQKSEIQANFPATIEEVVLSGTISNNVKSIFYKKEDRKKANKVMEKVKIYDIRKKCFADLSGGQQQRVLIARALCATKDLIILDEPTTGLHSYDVECLLSILNRLTDAGNTVVVIEHNLDVIKTADHIIDLGPEGGEGGGTIVAEGTPEEVSQIEKSYTGQFLRKVLG